MSDEFVKQPDINDLLETHQLLKLDEYETDLRIYTNEKNRIRKDAILKKIVDKYRGDLGYNQSDIISHAALLAVPETDDERKSYDLQELLNLQTTLPNWLVPNLIASGGGLYMAAGSPKAGKTRIFAYQLAFSVMFSGEFLGFPCSTGPVLIFQCEESPAKVARTFRTKGVSNFNEQIAQALQGDKPLLKIETEFSIDSDLNYLKNLVREFKPALVIYDSLRAITKHLPVSENSPDISKYVYVLQKVHNYLEVPGLIIHHMSKGGKERGLEGVAGSLSLAGATDGVFRLYKDGSYSSNKHSAEIITDPREGLPIHWKIELQRPKSGYWNYVITEDLGVSPDQHRLERKILRYMSKHPKVLFFRHELAATLGADLTTSSFNNAVDRLVDSLQIAEEQTKEGFKLWITESSPWSSLKEETLNSDFDIADKLTGLTTKQEIEKFVDSWSAEQKVKIFNLLSPKEQLKLTEALYESKFNIGDWVKEVETEELHKIKMKTLDSSTKLWTYIVENNKAFKEEELELSLDYAEADYSEEL